MRPPHAPDRRLFASEHTTLRFASYTPGRAARVDGASTDPTGS